MEGHVKEHVIAESVFFDKKTAILMTEHEHEETKFSRVSQSFEALTLYPESEVVNCPLNMILPLPTR
jgi:hypothetical protein